MRMQNKKSKKGFSIVELMAVVVIIGVLTQLAMSRYRTMVANSRQAEAQLNLHTIDDLQEAYYLEHEKYESTDAAVGRSGNCTDAKLKNKLGFRPKDCGELRYKYAWGAATAKATSDATDKIYPGCTGTDEWTLTYSNGNINNNDDVVVKCK